MSQKFESDSKLHHVTDDESAVSDAVSASLSLAVTVTVTLYARAGPRQNLAWAAEPGPAQSGVPWHAHSVFVVAGHSHFYLWHQQLLLVLVVPLPGISS